MAEEEKPDPTETEEEATPEEQKSTQEEEKVGLLTRFLTPKWLASARKENFCALGSS